MSNHLAPFHFDNVGSFLRPRRIKKKLIKLSQKAKSVAKDLL